MKLPVLSAKDVLKVLEKNGYYIHNQKGSHIHLRHSTKPPLTIPNHKELARGTLKAIIETAGLNIADFA